MNIKDVKIKKIKGDKLNLIFKRQKELMKKYHKIEKANEIWVPDKLPLDLNNCKCQYRIKDFLWRITEELGEAGNCLKNKPWKQTQVETDVDHFIEELADAFHFWIELCIMIGLTADDLFEFYYKKSEVNAFRQRSKY